MEIEDIVCRYRRMQETMMSFMGCGTIWGGVHNVDLNSDTQVLSVSVYCSAADGGKGGDVYYFSVCGGQRVSRVVIGDVNGHGEKVSQIGTWLYDSLLKHKNIYGEDKILSDLNRRVTRRGLEALTTMASISYYKNNSHLYFSYAGHPPAMICRRSDQKWEPLLLEYTPKKMTNIPLGISEDAHYTQNDLPIQSGDKLVLYTDGVLETANANNEMYGRARLQEILESLKNEEPEAIKKGVIQSLYDHSNAQLNHDDITFIVIHIN